MPEALREEDKEAVTILKEVLKRYEVLKNAQNELNTNFRDIMGKAKACGLSTVCLKTLLDWKINPNKYELFQNTTPLLEVYQEQISL